MTMILNQAIVFDDETLISLESILHSKFVGNNIKTQIRKACRDYKLLKRCLPAKGLTKEVIFFLLDPASATIKGVQTFFEKLQTWLVIVPELEQQLYQELVLEYYEPRDDWDEEDISKIRDNLISVVFELQPVPDTKIPMQCHPDYHNWENLMTPDYGDDSAQSTVEDIMPDIKGKAIPDVFNMYLDTYPNFSSW